MCILCAAVGVGNVCSYAEMSIRRHGNPKWNTFGGGDGGDSVPRPSEPEQAELGKTEMSLIQFKVRCSSRMVLHYCTWVMGIRSCLVRTLKDTPNLYFLSEVLAISTG